MAAQPRRRKPDVDRKGDHIMTKKKGRIGSSFDDYLGGQGTLDETMAEAVKRVLAWQLEEAMEKEQLSKNQMAKMMNTSRSQLDRVLDPGNSHIRLDTLSAAARAVGRELRIELV
jgi:antitoxin HicB